tara:strand:- start:4642 stop:4830 length:189 start_codon:yes stop_codon:yes gene_type:complete
MTGNIQSIYTWGVDGYGRAHISKRQSNVVLFCMIGEGGGMAGVWILEGQDRDNMFDAPDWDI